MTKDGLLLFYSTAAEGVVPDIQSCSEQYILYKEVTS